MTFRAARQSRPFVALALVSLGLSACSSSTPTAPSSFAASDAAPAASTASVASSTADAATATASSADTIKINKGTLALPSGLAGSVTLKGSRGFRFDGRVQSGLPPSAYCEGFAPCPPGTPVPLRVAWVGIDIPGTVRLQGDEFPVGRLDIGTSMFLELTGSFVTPAHLADTASVTVPFEATGLLTREYPFPQLPLTGGGQVTFTLEWQPFLGGWAITYSSFEFHAGGGRG